MEDWEYYLEDWEYYLEYWEYYLEYWEYLEYYWDGLGLTTNWFQITWLRFIGFIFIDDVMYEVRVMYEDIIVR